MILMMRYLIRKKETAETTDNRNGTERVRTNPET